jgi:hypothetical protein
MKYTPMKSIIINQHWQPKLFKELHDAMTDGSEIEGGYVTRYYEYNTAGHTVGMFTLCKAVDDVPCSGT